MKNVFRGLVPLLLIISMIFTMGIESISINNPILADTKEEVLEAPSVESIDEESSKKDLEVLDPNEGVKEEIKDPEKTVEPSEIQEEGIEKPEVEDPKVDKENLDEKAKESNEDKQKDVDEEKTKEESEAEVEGVEDLEKEDEAEDEGEELEELRLILTGSKIMIEESIVLGSANSNTANNYMEVTGGDGNYSYEWRVSDEEEIFSQDRNPTVTPTSDADYELIVRDSRGSEARSNMTIIVEKGSIEITNLIEGLNFKDRNRNFDIFIHGPEGRLYTVSLIDRESKTLENLKSGDYTISTIIPMNYKLLSISNKKITVSLDNKDHKATIKNIRTNYSWFYSESLF